MMRHSTGIANEPSHCRTRAAVPAAGSFRDPGRRYQTTRALRSNAHPGSKDASDFAGAVYCDDVRDIAIDDPTRGAGRGELCIQANGGARVDPRTFDRIIRRLSGALSRRSLVGGSLGAAVLTAVGLGDNALAKKTDRGQVNTENCIPTGKTCPRRGRRGDDRRERRTCEDCCQGTFVIVGRKGGKKKGKTVKKCSCIPFGENCKGDASNCCTGVCGDGVCQQSGCTNLTGACTTDAECCSTVCNAAGFGPTGDTCTTCRTGGADCADSAGEDTCCGERTCTASGNTECCSLVGESCASGGDCCDLTGDCDDLRGLCCVPAGLPAPGGCTGAGATAPNPGCCSEVCNVTGADAGECT